MGKIYPCGMMFYFEKYYGSSTNYMVRSTPFLHLIRTAIDVQFTIKNLLLQIKTKYCLIAQLRISTRLSKKPHTATYSRQITLMSNRWRTLLNEYLPRNVVTLSYK